MITINVNGEARELAQDSTLAGLIATLGFDPNALAALHNDDIVAREAFRTTPLKQGDIVELVRLMPGG